MGILNVTPDSFSDGGRYLRPGLALARGLKMIAEGADLIDVGGESTRPGAPEVSETEELKRVLPVIEELAARADVPISIDTRKAGVARRCLTAGAVVLNDVGGLRDPAMVEVAAELSASVVLMHMRGSPATMQRNTEYVDVVSDVKRYLEYQAACAQLAGVREVAIDPGLGFGKTAKQNFRILAELRRFTATGYPVLIGPSRKSFLGSLPSRVPVHERLPGTLAAVAVGAINGARIVRVHDVRPCRHLLEVLEAVEATRDPR